MKTIKRTRFQLGELVYQKRSGVAGRIIKKTKRYNGTWFTVSLPHGGHLDALASDLDTLSHSRGRKSANPPVLSGSNKNLGMKNRPNESLEVCEGVGDGEDKNEGFITKKGGDDGTN